MKRRTLLQSIPAAALVPASLWAAPSTTRENAGASDSTGDTTLPTTRQSPENAAQAATKVYELRVYHTFPGKLPDLLTRFRDHTTKLFESHGMKNVAYWTPIDEPAKSSTLYYILEHPSREAATANWKAFRDDPEWKSVAAKSEENGKLVEKVDSTFLTLTDFSPILR
ncbi:MAG: hypothetical protein NVS9B4_11460 [Candidatus Acidiferrum sp.]